MKANVVLAFNSFARLLAVVLCASCCAAKADILTADFNNFMGTPVSGSFGTITLTLNGDGTIGASLTANSAISGVGIDSATTLPVSNFSSGTTVNTSGWDSATYGHFATGFSFWQPYPTPPITWTIGTPGEFTSVRDILDGNGSAFDFLLVPISAPGQGAWAALAPPVPEPTTWALVFLGGALLALRQRA
jgi:hypothetical protein